MDLVLRFLVDEDARRGAAAGEHQFSEAARASVQQFLLQSSNNAEGPEETNPARMLPSVEQKDYSMVSIIHR
jgi:hypothetical protein